MDRETALTHRRDCPRCGYINGRAQIEETPEGPHWGKLVCFNCGAWWGWISKPGAEKRHRPAAHRDLVHKYSPGYCELCLRPEDEVTLHAHHVIPFHAGGESVRENIWILCEACHTHVEWTRTYHGRKTVPQLETTQ